jgi:Segment polarity protein dishevelled (Dsh) C terminal
MNASATHLTVTIICGLSLILCNRGSDTAESGSSNPGKRRKNSSCSECCTRTRGGPGLRRPRRGQLNQRRLSGSRQEETSNHFRLQHQQRAAVETNPATTVPMLVVPSPVSPAAAAPPSAAPPQRFILFLFDDLHLSASDLVHVQKVATKIVAGALADSDMAAVVSF